MDRLVANENKNKSDGRDFWRRCYIAGKEACRYGISKLSCPRILSRTARQEWIAGWNDECDKKYNDEEMFYVDYKSKGTRCD